MVVSPLIVHVIHSNKGMDSSDEEMVGPKVTFGSQQVMPCTMLTRLSADRVQVQTSETPQLKGEPTLNYVFMAVMQ